MMSRFRAAVTVAVTTTLLAASATSGHASQFGPGQQACAVQNVEKQANTSPSLATVEASSQVACPRTTAPPPGVDTLSQGPQTGPIPVHQQYDPPPRDATPCETQYIDEAATIVWGLYGPELHWLMPDGTTAKHVNGDMATAPAPTNGLIPVDLAESVAGTNHLVMRLRNDHATYGGANGWSCGGGFWVPSDSCTYNGGVTTSCARTVFVGPMQPISGQIPDPRPELLLQEQKLRTDVTAGLVGASPADVTRQFAFLPSCFWMTGASTAKNLELQIHAPATGGRNITYVYRVSVGLQDIHWDYGDGASYNGDVGHPWSSAAPDDCTNAHTYQRISRLGNPGAVACPASYPHPTADDGCYAVTATETYSVRVAAYWFDGANTHGPVDLGSFAPIRVGPALPTYIRVLQIEGVPVTR
jgi:hypothetical protein